MELFGFIIITFIIFIIIVVVMVVCLTVKFDIVENKVYQYQAQKNSLTCVYGNVLQQQLSIALIISASFERYLRFK